VADAEKVTITLEDLQICYEVGTLHDQAKMDRMRKGCSYYVDVPTVTAEHVASGGSFSTNQVYVPQGAKLTALTWMPEWQLYHNRAKKKFLAANFHFPPNATRVKVGFPGETPLYFENGFENLGTTEAYKAATSVWYHRALTNKSLYQHDFNLLFPRVSTTRGFDQVLFVFQNEMKEHAEQLRVECVYDSQLSQANWLLVSTVLQQYRFHYTDKMPIKMERV
jgi:hypothetical protein